MAYKSSEILDALHTGQDNIDKKDIESSNIIAINTEQAEKDEELSADDVSAARRMLNLILTFNKNYTYAYKDGFDVYNDKIALYIPENSRKPIEPSESDHALDSIKDTIFSVEEKSLTGSLSSYIASVNSDNWNKIKDTNADYSGIKDTLYCNQIIGHLKELGDDGISGIFNAIDHEACDSTGKIVQKYKSELTPTFSKAFDIYEKGSNENISIEYQIKDAQMPQNVKNGIGAFYNMLPDCFDYDTIKLNESVSERKLNSIEKNKGLYEKWSKWAVDNLTTDTGTIYYSQIKDALDKLSNKDRVELFSAMNYGYNIKEKASDFNKTIFDKSEKVFKNWEAVKSLYKDDCDEFEKECLTENTDTTEEAQKKESELKKDELSCIASIFTYFKWLNIDTGNLYPNTNIQINDFLSIPKPDTSLAEKSEGRYADSTGKKDFDKWSAWIKEKFPKEEGKAVYFHTVKDEFDKLKIDDFKSFLHAIDFGLVPDRSMDSPSVLPNENTTWTNIKAVYDKACNDYEKSTNSGTFKFSDEKINDIKTLATAINQAMNLTGTSSIKGGNEAVKESIIYIANEFKRLAESDDIMEKNSQDFQNWVIKNLTGCSLYHLYNAFNKLDANTKNIYTAALMNLLKYSAMKNNIALAVKNLFKTEPAIKLSDGTNIELMNQYLMNKLAEIVNFAVGANIIISKVTPSGTSDEEDICKKLGIKLQESDSIPNENAKMADFINASRAKEKADAEHKARMNRTSYENDWFDRIAKWSSWVKSNLTGKNSIAFNQVYCSLKSNEKSEFLLYIDHMLQSKKTSLNNYNASFGKVFKLYLDGWDDFIFDLKYDQKDKAMDDKDKEKYK